MSFTRRAGERLAVIGPNGAGKTTLLSILGGHRSSRRPATVQRGDARRRLGPAAAGGLRQAQRRREPAAVRAARAGRRRRRRGRARARADRPGRARRRRARRRCRAATASASTSRSACSPTRRCCCSTSRPRRSTRATASACGRFLDRLAERRHDDRLRDARPRRGRAPRRPRARPRRRRAAVQRHAGASSRPRSGRRRTSRRRSSQFLHGARPLRCAGCSLKDLQILRRSPLLVVLLVAYPVARRAADRLRAVRRAGQAAVAFVNERARRGRRRSASAARSATPPTYAERLFDAVDPIRVDTPRGGDREGRVRRGARRADHPAPTPPSGCATRSASPGTPSARRSRSIYNGEDPLKRRFVESTIESRLAEANLALSGEITKIGARLPRHPAQGRDDRPLPAGVRRARPRARRRRSLRERARRSCPRARAARDELERVARFAAARGRQPRPLRRDPRVDRRAGRRSSRPCSTASRTPLDAFAVAVAVTVSLMFVTVLLAAGMLALEREEHAFGRLVRGLVTRHGAAGREGRCSRRCARSSLAALLVAGLSAVRRHRVVAGAAVAARARARRAGLRRARRRRSAALAREVRAASLLAFLLVAADRVPRARPERRGRRRRSSTSSRRSRPRSRSSRRSRRSTAR